jgi:hypothetical protein
MAPSGGQPIKPADPTMKIKPKFGDSPYGRPWDANNFRGDGNAPVNSARPGSSVTTNGKSGKTRSIAGLAISDAHRQPTKGKLKARPATIPTPNALAGMPPIARIERPQRESLHGYVRERRMWPDSALPQKILLSLVHPTQAPPDARITTLRAAAIIDEQITVRPRMRVSRFKAYLRRARRRLARRRPQRTRARRRRGIDQRK